MIDYDKLKKGDVLIEYGYGTSIMTTVVSDVKVTEWNDLTRNRICKKWSWVGLTDDGREIPYLITEGLEHYGPNLEYVD